MSSKVHYERVNLADIDTSSDDDDYGDLFAAERGRIVKGRQKIAPRKKSKSCAGGGCIKGLCILFSVLLLLLVMAGVAIYNNPGGVNINNDATEGPEVLARNVTSVDVVKFDKQAAYTKETNTTVNSLNMTVTTAELYSESETDSKNPVDENLNSLESWSSSMAAAGNLSRSPGSSHRNTSRVPESAE